MRLGLVHCLSMSRKSSMSKGMTRVPPSWCSAGGCTSTGMGAMVGFAAAPYSKMEACAAHAFSVAAGYGPPHVSLTPSQDAV